MSALKIKDLFDSQRKVCYLAAEVGTNHNGSLDLALEMIEKFAGLGAHGIKFQALRADRLYPEETPVAEYLIDKGAAPRDAKINDLIRRVEFKEGWIRELVEACDRNRVEFLCSVFDPESLDELVAAGLESIKIASTEITHYPLLTEAGQTGLPIILSTGMAGLGEIEKALEKIGHERVILLHCTAAYPALPQEVNLRAMVNLGRTFGLPVGFSDHTEGHLAAACAVSLGACLVEKHVTPDRKMPGPDHHFAASPKEYEKLVQAVCQAEAMLGSARKKATRSEKDLIAYRPGLFSVRTIEKGETLTREMIKVMRRNRTGIKVEHLDIVLGRTARQLIEPGQALEWFMI